MFILMVRYIKPAKEVDQVRDAHLDWLREGHEAGHFIAWGRRVPLNGGVIFARGERAQVETLAQTDPFITSGVAEVDVIEWTPSFLAEGLEALSS
jgi:uncharacterized protein YciI